MRVLIQRVEKASVTVDKRLVGAIKKGLLVFLGIGYEDDINDITWLCKKLCQLRIFNDKAGLMNLSVQDVQGEILVVSQFTLLASTKKGNRPSYIRSAKPEVAIPLYEAFINHLKDTTDLKIETGAFGAMMDVELINDGPVTIWIDSKNKE